MTKIAPSILAADFARLNEEIRRVGGADLLHVDVMDGQFVPNISIGVPVVAAVRRVTGLFLDVHLMIDKPVRYIDAFAEAGADLLSVHLEADHPSGIRAALEKMAARGVKRGIALRPIAAAEAVIPYLKDGLDLVLVMTVEPGFGGQAFMPEQLKTIERVRQYIDAYCPDCDLQVDGGINAETAPLVRAAGANVLVAGTAIFGAEDPQAAMNALRGEG